MNDYILSAHDALIGISICIGLIIGLVIFAFAFGDWINDKHTSETAPKRADAHPVAVDLTQLERAA